MILQEYYGALDFSGFRASQIKSNEAQTADERLQRPPKMDVFQIDQTFDFSAAFKFPLFQASDIL